MTLFYVKILHELKISIFDIKLIRPTIRASIQFVMVRFVSFLFDFSIFFLIFNIWKN